MTVGVAQVTLPDRKADRRIVVRVDAERQLLLIKGSVPGASGRDVIVRPAVKR